MAKVYAGSGQERALDIRHARESERERCAKIADDIGANHAEDDAEIWIARKIATAIRDLR
jgi:hypothetical protein